MRNHLHDWECSSVQDDTCLWQERNLATHKNTWLSLSSSHLHHTLFLTLIFYWKRPEGLKSRSFQDHCGMFLHMPIFQTKRTRSLLKDHLLLLATCFNLCRLMMPCLRACVWILPCIPVGPNSWRVRKMAWSWYSLSFVSFLCCSKAQRHTFSRLWEGLPSSMRLVDWKHTWEGRYTQSYILIFAIDIWSKCESITDI